MASKFYNNCDNCLCYNLNIRMLRTMGFHYIPVVCGLEFIQRLSNCACHKKRVITGDELIRMQLVRRMSSELGRG